MLKDSDKLDSLGLGKGGKLFFRDLGPQVGWTTVSRPFNLCYVYVCSNYSKDIQFDVLFYVSLKVIDVDH